MRRAQTFRYLDVLIQPIKMPFKIFRMSDFVRFSLDIKVLILLPKMHICSRFCLIFVHISFSIKIGLSHLGGSCLCRQFAIAIVSAQKLIGKPLSMSSESFIIARVFQDCSVIRFFSCIYDATQSIVMLFLLQKLLNVVLINFTPPLVCRHPSFSPQALACGSQRLKALRKSSLIQSKKTHDF